MFFITPFFLGYTDKKCTEDEKVSESQTVLSLDGKETDNKGVLFSKYLVYVVHLPRKKLVLLYSPFISHFVCFCR